jgi:thiol-disulfide isomerase/thioredoxin
MNSLRTFSTRAAVAVAVLLGQASGFAADLGQPAPDVDLPGSAVAQKLSDLKGKVVYVDFWASWCGPCKQSFPWMNDMQRKYGARGLQVVAINLDAKRGDADQFLAQNPATVALAFDSKGESARRMGVKGMPTSLLVGADGKVLLVHQGFRNEDRTELEAKLVAALAASGGKTP